MAEELAICTRELTKRFDRHIAVNKVDMQVKQGEVYGLIGPNGAGKTTLIRMLAAAEEPTKGEIYINGQRLLQDNSSRALKRYIGYLPDDFPIYEDLNVWDYLYYFACLYRIREPRRSRRLQEVLELVGLCHKKQSLIPTLSRGMRQRIGLARAIIHEPLIMLLDEPVSGLDPLARLEFREIIKELRDTGITVLISSHILSDLEDICTSIGIMEMGYLVENASLSELQSRLSQQVILLSTLGDLKILETALKNHSSIQNWERVKDTNSLRIVFGGDSKERMQLLKFLVESDIPLTEFHCTQGSLEDIFIKIGHRQIS